MNEQILHVLVGQPLSDSLANAASMMEALERNQQGQIHASFDERCWM